MTLLWNWSLLLCILWTIDCSCPFLFLPSLQQQQLAPCLLALPSIQLQISIWKLNFLRRALCSAFSVCIFSPFPFALHCMVSKKSQYTFEVSMLSCFSNVLDEYLPSTEVFEYLLKTTLYQNIFWVYQVKKLLNHCTIFFQPIQKSLLTEIYLIPLYLLMCV